MPMVAHKSPYTLLISEDDMPLNPRKESDNLGKMVCWHSHYQLGDQHKFDEPRDFLTQILFQTYASNAKTIYDFIKAGKAADAKFQYNRSNREWELWENIGLASSDWYKTSSYPASLKGGDIPCWFLDDCLSALKNFEMISLLEQSGQIVLMPLYLYDHSGITMSTSPFSCPWDSGQVGWIYADRDMMEKEYGVVTPEVIKQVQTVLENEVETYDYYLTDQCYGFQLFEGDVEIDSCWGFLGDIRSLQNNLKEYMPEGFENIVENLQYESDNFDIEEYIHELKDTDELEYAR
ncbi:hypothetical protein [Fumia xinanensis]|uniref:Uncharacterized protein n=1 Tax=Fumia xinanensis TaxID=2763659 RepID=A0A926E326_9FIRM|nr:hypothetical protein [Fumia xinanensis]MBC8560779.1 hypothetical protein [Fumia xinanensis]